MNVKFNIFIIFSLLIMTTLPINGQESTENSSDSTARANEILNQARKVIDKEGKIPSIKSLFLASAGSSYDKTTSFPVNEKPRINEMRLTVKNEYSLEFPLLARAVRQVNQSDAGTGVQFKLESAVIGNGDDVTRSTETLVNGQKIDMSNNPNLQKMLGTGDPTGDSQKPPRAVFDGELQTELFPILLSNPFGDMPKFNYVGQAEADGKKADVLELQSSDTTVGATKQTTRYFFDSESHLLLLVTKDYSFDGIQRTTATYFSAHREMNGFLIPTKIKEESKIVSKKPTEIMGFKFTGSEQNRITELEIADFEINRKFPEKTFQIKK